MNFPALYAEFVKIGFFSVGGGLATLPFFYDMAAKQSWLSTEQVGNALAIAQSSPGAIGVNMAAQTGYLAGGAGGAFLAALGLVTPPVIIILIVARILGIFKESRPVKAVFGGLRPAAAGLIAAAGFTVIRLSLFNAGFRPWYEGLRTKEILLFAAIFILVWKFKKHPILYIAAAGAAGIALGLSG